MNSSRILLRCLGLTMLVVNLFGAEPVGIHSKQAPDWAASAVWYQIFPERFRNGDPNNDPIRASLEPPIMAGSDWRISSWTADWYARDNWETALGKDFYKGGVFERRYGGDLQGVLYKLDYLKDLGINALYFNPLFYARSMHKYDGNSYHHIDPYFGPDPAGDFTQFAKETSDPATWRWTAADRLFLKLLKEAHARGMKIIIDGVFNHTGRDFFAFRDVVENQERSTYKDWYVITSYDNPDTLRNEFDYKGWWGFKSLPVFASANDGHDIAPGPKAYIFNSTRRWMDPDGTGDTTNGVDGWRLDAADERPNQFWAEWNTFVRSINPDAYTSAEIWKDPKSMILDGGFSATMNYYCFAFPVKGWLVDNHLTPTRFARQFDGRRNSLPHVNAYVMMNLMDSHDTDRLASMIVNGEKINYHDPDQVDYNANDDLRKAPNYVIRKPDERDRAIQRLVVLMQMTAVGAPMIYYGDEAGMWGATDPDDRQPMVWADLKYAAQTNDPRVGYQSPQEIGFNKEVFDAYHNAIMFRRGHTALNTGEYTPLVADDQNDTLAFARGSGVDALLVAFNRSDKTRTLSLRLASVPNGASMTKPAVLFSTGGQAEIKRGSDTVEVTLPPLTGAVIGAVP